MALDVARDWHARCTSWAAFAPVTSPSRQEVFRIPNGTWARRMSGDKVEILPAQVRLTLGVRDILVLENHDAVPQIFGPTLLMPGQSFELPFAVASSYQFACTAHVERSDDDSRRPVPGTPWAKLRWRMLAACEAGTIN